MIKYDRITFPRKFGYVEIEKKGIINLHNKVNIQLIIPVALKLNFVSDKKCLSYTLLLKTNTSYLYMKFKLDSYAQVHAFFTE